MTADGWGEKKLRVNLIKKSIMLHGRQKIILLIPAGLNHDITITNDRGSYFVIANGTGYSYLSELFALGISLQREEILYLPLEFKNMDAYRKDFSGLNENHYSGLVLCNYCTSQYTAKDIISSIKTKTYREELIARTCGFSKELVDRWKTQHRTTVKESGSFIIISTNADGFTLFVQSCSNLAEYGDNTKYNEYPPHEHHDGEENTSKSLGITLYYWQSPGSSVK